MCIHDRPANLILCEEPDYKIQVDYPDGVSITLFAGQRCTWKRLSAIAHARYFARRNPTCIVRVLIAKE